MDFAESHCVYCLTWLSVIRAFWCLRHWQSCQNLIIYRQVLRDCVMGYLVIWALYHLVLEQLFYALKAETVTAWEGDWLLVAVVVPLETYAAFENRLHIIKLKVGFKYM